jgi:predicted phage terminase large subunit-like protein
MAVSEHKEFYALLREDLHEFIVWAYSVLNPGADDFLDNWHIEAIVHHLLKCYHGQTRRLLITMPPRSLKSHSVSVAFVAWMLGQDPKLKFICASYGEKPGDLLAEQTRSLMRHPDYLKAFPGTRFGANAPLDMLQTTAHGYRMTTSVSGAGTAFGCNFVIADDLTKSDATASERAKACTFYQGSLMSRFNKKSEGVAIVVAQRTAVDDLPGFLLDRGGYTHLNLPAIAQSDENIEIGPNRYKYRSKGELLHPVRESHETLELVRRDVGDDNFAAQYLQRPNARLGAILDPTWFPRYEMARPIHLYQYRVLSIDTALSTSMTADYSVCSVFGSVDDTSYDLLHVWRDRVGYEALSAKIDAMINEWQPTHIVIEHANAGISLFQQLRGRFSRGLIAFSVKIPKEDRLARLLNCFRRGLISLPMNVPWKAAFENEVFSFPSTAHDDQLDTLIQFANYADRGYHRYSPIEWGAPPRRRHSWLIRV